MTNLLKALTLSAVILVAVACPTTVFGVVTVVQHVRGFSYDLGSTVTCTLSPSIGGDNIIVGTLSEPYGNVSSISDTAGNVYSPANGSKTVATNPQKSEIWHSLGATGGVTSITITFGPAVYATGGSVPFGHEYKSCFAYEVSSGTLTFDVAAKVDFALCTTLCDGAIVTPSGASNFTLGIIVIGGDVAFLSIRSNEFTAGGDLGLWAFSAAESLVSSAGAHKPTWDYCLPSLNPNCPVTPTPIHVSASTAAYKE